MDALNRGSRGTARRRRAVIRRHARRPGATQPRVRPPRRQVHPRHCRPDRQPYLPARGQEPAARQPPFQVLHCSFHDLAGHPSPPGWLVRPALPPGRCPEGAARSRAAPSAAHSVSCSRSGSAVSTHDRLSRATPRSHPTLAPAVPCRPVTAPPRTPAPGTATPPRSRGRSPLGPPHQVRGRSTPAPTRSRPTPPRRGPRPDRS